MLFIVNCIHNSGLQQSYNDKKNSMLKKILFILLTITFLWGCTILEDETKGVVTATKLNIREHPSTQSAVIGQAEKGDTLIIKSMESGYANVLTEYGQGFVARKYIQVENINSFYFFLKTASRGEIISVLIPLLIIALLTLRILSYLLSKYSSLNYSYSPSFNFVRTDKNGFFMRRFNSTVYLMLGRRTQHPYLNYWIYVSLFWFLIPMVFFGFFDNFLFFIDGLKNNALIINNPIKFGFMMMYLLSPGVLFIAKAIRNSKSLPSKEWLFVLLALLFSFPIIIIAATLALRWLVIIMLNIFIFFVGSISKSDWRRLHYINGGDPGDIAM